MPAELLRFPVRALKVKVAGFQPPRIRPASRVLPYAPQWTVDALMCMLESLHGQVTASVVVSSFSSSMGMSMLQYGNVMSLVPLYYVFYSNVHDLNIKH